MDVSRRSFCKAVAAGFFGIATGALAWDAVVNEGRPACADPDEEDP